MSKRYDIMTPRKGRDKTFWTRIGTAFEGDKTYWTNIGTAWFNDNGGIQLVFDALPLPDAEGRCVANLFEPRERDSGGQTQQRQAEPVGIDDDVPF